MIIQSVTANNSPFESPFVIAPETDNRTQGHITVMIGENGVRKSLALRLLMDAALGKSTHEGHGHPAIPVEIACVGSKPRKVIAVSLTPWDRFPRSWALSELATSIPWFGYHFAYIGPRSREGMISSRYSEAAFGRVMLENCTVFKKRSMALEPIFERLGLSQSVGIRFSPKWKALRLKGGDIPDYAMEKLHRFLAKRLREINGSEHFSDHWKRTITHFVQKFSTEEGGGSLWRSLEESTSKRIACWITGEGIQFARGFKSIEEWRCALYLDLFEVSGVFFAARGTNLPVDAKNSLRESDLSSGQWNWLYNLVSLCMELDDDSLILIDEPENSLHPSWQRDFVSTLSSILKCCNGCHAVVATHSALIASGVRDGLGNVRRLVLRKSTPEQKPSAWKTVSEAPLLDAYGAQVDDVYRELFDLDSTRTPEFVTRVDDMLSLIRDAHGERPVVAVDDHAYVLEACERLPSHDPMRSILRAIADSVVPKECSE